MKNYLIKKGSFDEESENVFVKDVRKQVLKQLSVSKNKLKPHWSEMFEDVYAEMPQHLKDQMQELDKHIEDHEDY